MSNQFPSWQNEIDTCFDLDPAILTIQSVHDPEKSTVSILDLNIDCLLKIFSYLAMKDLLNIEKSKCMHVCILYYIHIEVVQNIWHHF